MAEIDDEQPLSFSEVEQVYKRARQSDPFFAGMTLQGFSRYMNRNLGKPLYSAGDVGGFGAGVKRVSSALDVALQPASERLGSVGEQIGSAIGPKTARVGRVVGETLPRGAIDTGLFAAALAAGGVPGAVLGTTALASAGAKGYTDTGSPTAGAIQAAALPLTMGTGAGAGTSVAATALREGAIGLGKKTATAISRPVGELVERALGPGVAGVAERAIEYGGMSLSALVAQEAANEAISKVVTGEFHNPLEPERLGVTIAGTLPFMAFDVPTLSRGYKMNKSGNLTPASVVDMFRSGELPGATRSYAQHLRDVIAFKNVIDVTKREAHLAPGIHEPGHKANQPTITVPSVPGTATPKDKVAAETKAVLENRPSAASDLAGLTTVSDFVGYGAVHGHTGRQTFDLMPDDVKAKVPGKDNKEKIDYLRQERNLLLSGKRDLFAPPSPFETAQKFTGEQLHGEVFGSIAVEQLNNPTPFGYKVAPDGTLPTDGVKRGMGKLLTKAELGIYQEAGLDAWLATKGHKVGTQELQRWLMENGPRVEVRKYEALPGHDPRAEVNRIAHELETLGYRPALGPNREPNTLPVRWTLRNGSGIPTTVPKEHIALLKRFDELDQIGPSSVTPSATARFTSVNPKPLNQMEGAVDILVKRPTRQFTQEQQNKRITEQGLYDKEEPTKFSEGSHFPNDKNVIGFARAYMETLEDGTKVFHVFEVQSDWAQRRRRVEASEPAPGTTGEVRKQSLKELDDPLLHDWQRMVLKATIKHAIDSGAQRIAISDAATAMLTEGHDRFTRPKVIKVSPTRMSRAEADKWLNDERVATKNPNLEVAPDGTVTASELSGAKLQWQIVDRSQQEIRQAKGMELNYDQLLPGIMKELTGYEGVTVDFGDHQNAFETHTPSGGVVARPQGPRSDLVLRNPDGTDKTTVTARAYGLDKAREELLRRGGFTFFGKDKLLPFIQRMDKLGMSDEQKAQALVRLQSVAARPGEDVYDFALRYAGIDAALFQQNEPTSTMNGVQKFFRWLFWAHGENDARIEALTRRALYVAARFGPLAGRYKVALASEGNPFTVRPSQGLYNGVVSLMFRGTGRQKDIALFDALWTQAHETFHAMQYALDARVPEATSAQVEIFERATVAASQLTPAERKATVVSMLQQLIPEGRLREVPLENTARYDDPIVGVNEFLADLAGLVAIGAETPKRMADQIRFGDTQFGAFADGFYKDMSAVFGVMTPALERLFKFTSGPEAKGAVKQLSTVMDNLNQLLVAKEDADKAVTAFLAMSERLEAGPYSEPPILTLRQLEKYSSVPKQLAEAYRSMMGRDWEPETSMRDVKEEADWLTKPKNGPSPFGDRLNLWDRFKPIAQLVKKFPALKETFDLAMSYIGISTNNTLALWNSFVDAKGKVDLPRLRRIAKDGSPMNNAIREIALHQNAREAIISTTEREKVSPAYRSMTKEDRVVVDLSLQQFGEIAVKAAIERVRGYRTRIEFATARVVQSHDKQMGTDEAVRIGQQMVRSIFDAKTMDPAEYAKLTADIMNLPLSPKAKQSALAVAQSNQKPFLSVRTTLMGENGNGKPWYMPEVRVKNWQIAWKELDGEAQLWDFATQGDAMKKMRDLKQLEADGKIEYIRAFNKEDRAAMQRGQVNEELLSLYADVEKKLYDSVLSNLDKENPAYEDVVTELRAEYQPGDAAAALVTSPYMHERQFVGGRERLNFVEGMVHYIDATSHGISKQFVKQKQALVLNSPELRANPNLRVTAKNYLSFVTDPQGKEFTAIKNLVFFNFMGFNPSSLMIEGTQQFLTLVPHLVREGAGVGQAYGLMTGAWHKIAKAAMTAQKKGVRVYDNINKVFDDVEIDDAVKRAISERVVDTGFVQDLYAEQDVDFINTRNLFSGKGTALDFRQLLTKPLYSMLGMARQFYGAAPKLNSLSAMVASFDFARSKGLKGEAAYQFAKDAVQTTMFGGGRITRPLALQQWGSATGVGGVLYTLQSYSFSMLAMMNRLTREAITGQLKGPERAAALKAAGLMWGTQALLGGVMGLPLVGASVALIEQFFPEAEVKKNLREAFVGLAGDDEEMGHIVADGAMSGAANLGPVDFGSRFQLGNLLGVSPYDGFSWKNLVGASASAAEGYLKGASKLAQGQIAEGVEQLLPVGTRQLTRLLNDGGVVRDAQERLVFEPTNVEKVFMGLGFRPKRLSQHYEQQGIMLRSERIQQEDTQEFYRDMAKRLSSGDVQAVRNALYTRQRSHPGFSVVNGVRRIAEIVQEMQVPKDLSRTGSRGNLQAGAEVQSLYPRTPGPSETQRVLQRSQLERVVGVPGTGVLDRGSLKAAQMIDRVMAANPTLTRAQAVMMVERALHPKTFRRAYGNE